jgi:hypothetical protein
MGMQIKVRLVKVRQTSTIVESDSDGLLKRHIVPSDWLVAVDDQWFVDSEQLAMGIPYGVEWEEYLQDYLFSKESIANSLRKQGIWTLEDYNSKPKSVQDAIISVCLPEILRDAVRVVKIHRQEN